ncbi:MAG TPA: Gfo/Idh/MocA family oxidoreductase [Tepidiformaceae bacterium]|nr:Gfo/Idh/MocA family oxidoreductase [Tepidiformaceae bacterium]
MTEDKRVLVVGAGTMGGGYARMLASGRVPGATLAGIVDIDGARALELANGTGSTAFGDIETAIAQLRPDAAYVATPDAHHRAPVEALAAGGVAILVEKPLATTNDDAAAMLQAVTSAGVYAEVNYSNRWNPPFVEAMRSVESGDLGEIRSFNVCLNNPVASPRERLSWSGGTTPAWVLMSHCLDLALFLGRKRAVTAYASGGRGELSGAGIETYDWIHAVIRYADGADGVFESCWILPDSWPGGIEFNFKAIGTKGALTVDTTRQGLAVAAEKYRYPGTLQWAPQRFQAFLRGMEGAGRSRVSFEDGAEVTRILVAVHKSLESGQVERV